VAGRDGGSGAGTTHWGGGRRAAVDAARTLEPETGGAWGG
jgi:hypothetical protein